MNGSASKAILPDPHTGATVEPSRQSQGGRMRGVDGDLIGYEKHRESTNIPQSRTCSYLLLPNTMKGKIVGSVVNENRGKTYRP